MNNSTRNASCAMTCWIVAALAGLLAAVLLLLIGNWGFIQSLFVGALIFIIGGALLQWAFCKSLPAPNESTIDASQTPLARAQAANAGGASTSTAAAASGATASSLMGGAGDADITGGAGDDTIAGGSAGDDLGVGTPKAATATAAASTSAVVKPSTPLKGQQELADRKGDWKYEKPAAATPKKAAAKKAPAKKAAVAKTAAPAKKAATAKAAGAATADAKTASAKKAPAKAKAAPAAKAAATKAAPSKATTGKTTAKATTAKAATAKAATGKAATSKAAAPKSAAKPVAADGKPALLKKARASGADDLKQIKGVGPGLEKTLNELGFFHFDQVAAWRKKEIQWVDDRLKFKGRIERDEWTKQAKVLAKGGTTEFSKKVKKGGVY